MTTEKIKTVIKIFLLKKKTQSPGAAGQLDSKIIPGGNTTKKTTGNIPDEYRLRTIQQNTCNPKTDTDQKYYPPEIKLALSLRYKDGSI